MNDRTPDLTVAFDMIVANIRGLLANHDPPILVALDGGSGSGKSTLAKFIAQELAAVVVQGDDFFAADVTDADWAARTPKARAADVMDWQRLKTGALEPLLAGEPARWHALDFEAGKNTNGTYAMRTDFVVCEPKEVIILDCAFSTGSELADLIDYSVLLDVPVDVRHERLAARAEDKTFLDDWHSRWDVVEKYYYTHIRPLSSFDLVVCQTGQPVLNKCTVRLGSQSSDHT